MKRVTSHIMLLVLLVLATAGMVLQTGSVPHVHAMTQAGLYNQEHDLTLLASLSGSVITVANAPALTVDVVSLLAVALAPERPPLPDTLTGDSRAPPAR